MKAIGAILEPSRQPTADESEAIGHVLEIASAWRSGLLDIAGVRSVCSGYERWQAMRFSPAGSDARALLVELLDALVLSDASGFQSHRGWVLMEEEVFGKANARTDVNGARVWVWPMHSMHGEAVYPLNELPRDMRRVERHHAATMVYVEYRRKKRGG